MKTRRAYFKSAKILITCFFFTFSVSFYYFCHFSIEIPFLLKYNNKTTTVSIVWMRIESNDETKRILFFPSTQFCDEIFFFVLGSFFFLALTCIFDFWWRTLFRWTIFVFSFWRPFDATNVLMLNILKAFETWNWRNKSNDWRAFLVAFRLSLTSGRFRFAFCPTLVAYLSKASAWIKS